MAKQKYEGASGTSKRLRWSPKISALENVRTGVLDFVLHACILGIVRELDWKGEGTRIADGTKITFEGHGFIITKTWGDGDAIVRGNSTKSGHHVVPGPGSRLV